MSLPVRLCALLLLSYVVSACGFKPLYGTSSVGAEHLLGGVAVENIGGRDGQLFKQNLEDQLNPSGAVPANPAYRLHIYYSSVESPIGTERDGTVTRYNVYLRSFYKLYRNSDDVLMTTGSINHVSSYNNRTNEYYSTYIAQKDAIKRGVNELSKVYRQRLGAYFADGAPITVEDPEKEKEALDAIQETIPLRFDNQPGQSPFTNQTP